ncbi:MAG: hypothetical protein WA775_13740 [Psychroserpens sp.]|uniref:hypothetical protein n=1 Tax=Psychroserpens sp. TaxID=2020870 RepID=UPI003C7FE2D6
MKFTKNIFILFSILTFITSCDELDELTEIDITQDFSTTVNVVLEEDSEGEPVSITETSIIDLASNQDIQDNLDAIEDVQINSITYQINNYVGAEDIVVTNASLNFDTTVISVADINLLESDTNNTVYTISDSAQLNAIAAYLEDNSSITVTLTGTISSTPALFDVIISVDTTVTVDAG